MHVFHFFSAIHCINPSTHTHTHTLDVPGFFWSGKSGGRVVCLSCRSPLINFLLAKSHCIWTASIGFGRRCAGLRHDGRGFIVSVLFYGCGQQRVVLFGGKCGQGMGKSVMEIRRTHGLMALIVNIGKPTAHHVCGAGFDGLPTSVRIVLVAPVRY